MIRSTMIQTAMKTSCVISFLLFASFALAQSEFSGEIVNLEKQGAPSEAKIYFAKDKVRIEPVASNGASRGGAVILNLATQTSTVLMDQQHMYMDIPPQAQGQRIAYNFFRTGDAENACADWLAQERNKGGTCRRVSSGDIVNGRSTVKYEATNSSGESNTFWIDPKLRFPVKWESKNHAGELRNIQEGSQASNLFEVPTGYTKFDVGSMMQRPQ
jgi:hypothetical protein